MLIVNDGTIDSASDVVTITVNPPPNTEAECLAPTCRVFTFSDKSALDAFYVSSETVRISDDTWAWWMLVINATEENDHLMAHLLETTHGDIDVSVNTRRTGGIQHEHPLHVDGHSTNHDYGVQIWSFDGNDEVVAVYNFGIFNTAEYTIRYWDVGNAPWKILVGQRRLGALAGRGRSYVSARGGMFTPTCTA